MSSKLRRLEAKTFLAGLFFRHLLGRVIFFWRRSPGLPAFLRNYANDAIFPITADERARLPLFQKCQACSLCTMSCTAIQEGRGPSSFEPKMLLMGFGRSSHEAEFFINKWAPCLECETCTVLCPVDVPVHAMAETIIARRKNLAFRAE